MKQGLSLRVSQHLALTPQLQQSIRLLQLSTLELEQELEKYLLENPLLEREDEDYAGSAPSGSEGEYASGSDHHGDVADGIVAAAYPHGFAVAIAATVFVEQHRAANIDRQRNHADNGHNKGFREFWL